MNGDKDISFRVSGKGVGDKRKYFNIDGSEATRVDVWVEALADKWFWLEYFQDNSDYKFNFRGPDEIDAKDKKRSTGCDRLFTLEKQKEIILGNDCILCLDSDDSYIKSFIPGFTSKKSQRPHVYTTKIYAIDNAFLLDKHVDHVFNIITTKGGAGASWPPSELISNIAKTTWSAYTGIYYLEAVGRNREFKVSQKLAYKLISKLWKADASNIQNCSTYKKFQAEYSKLESTVNAAIKAVDQQGYDKFITALENSGINQTTFYLFIRGHSLFDSTTSCYEVINETHKTNEINRVKKEYPDHTGIVLSIQRTWKTFPEILTAKFSARKTPVPFFCDTLKTLSDHYNLE